MYRIEIHIKQNIEPKPDCRHFSYNALWIDVKDNALIFVTQHNAIKSFNMDRVSYFRVHKIRGYEFCEQDGQYYKLFPINTNGVKYYCVGPKYDADVIYGFKKYADAAEVFNKSENATKGMES